MSAELGCGSEQASGKDQFPKMGAPWIFKTHRAKSTCKAFETEPHPGGLPSDHRGRDYRYALPHPGGAELGTEPSAWCIPQNTPPTKLHPQPCYVFFN